VHGHFDQTSINGTLYSWITYCYGGKDSKSQMKLAAFAALFCILVPQHALAEGATLILGFRLKSSGRTASPSMLTIPMSNLEQCEAEGAKVIASEKLSQGIYDERSFLCINSK
jgi:hypothetical protein